MPGIGEEWSYLPVGKTGDAAADAGHKEGELSVLPGKGDKLVDIGLDGLYTALHGGDGVALALQTDALPHYGAELVERNAGGTSGMDAAQALPS